MTLGSAVRVLLRRFWVLLVGLVLTLGATAFVASQTPPRYQATAQMILLLPADARAAEGAVSPFLYLPSSLQVLARIVVSGPNSREFHDEMLAAGLTSEYELRVESSSPIILVSVEGRDPQNVIATRDRIIDEVGEELLTVQREEETPPRQTAHARVYAIEPIPDSLQSNRTRGILLTLGVGGLLTLLAAFGIDRGIQLRAERHRRIAESAAADPGDGGTSQRTWGWGWDLPGSSVVAESTDEPDGKVEAASAQTSATDGQTDVLDSTGVNKEAEPEVERSSSGPGHEGTEGAVPASGAPNGEVTHYQRV